MYIISALRSSTVAPNDYRHYAAHTIELTRVLRTTPPSPHTWTTVLICGASDFVISPD